jgi:hypothetical protein
MKKLKAKQKPSLQQKQVFVSTDMLAERWNMSTNTLRNWRAQGRGPGYVKLGERILYRMRDIEEYENAHFRQAT